jgi:hypothetical protein
MACARTLGNHGPFIGDGASTVKEQSVFIGGSMPLFVLTEVLCGSQPSKFIAPKQALLKIPPGDMDTYTGSPGDEFTMLREKQKRAWIANNPYQVNFVSDSGVSVSSLLKNADWSVVGMVVCLRRTLPGPWELRCESDIGILPLRGTFCSRIKALYELFLQRSTNGHRRLSEVSTKRSNLSWTWKFRVLVVPL